MLRRYTLLIVLSTLAASLGMVDAASRSTLAAADPPASLWRPPRDLATEDLFYGSWGAAHAPDPNAIYRFIQRKHTGVNPGMTVRDPQGREWSVKQAPLEGWAAEGPVEVVLSRVLSAVGYHQPPVYYLPSFTLADDWGTHVERGGRFRLKLDSLRERGEWAWLDNPFTASREHQGLLVILLIFNSSDLKSSNNTMFEYRSGERLETWYVVRDIGTALGSTGRLVPRKNDLAAFEHRGFINGVRDGFVDFEYRGRHQHIVRGRITPDDVRWACDLLAGLTDRQWQDAFRAGGYEPDVAQRFIGKIQTKIRDGQQIVR
jgi:hypothetical protein